MNYDSLRVIKWCCDFSFAVPFNFIRFLFSILCICFLLLLVKFIIHFRFLGHNLAVRKIVSDPFDADRFMSCSYDKTVRSWNMKNELKHFKLEHHREFVYGLDISHFQQFLAVSCSWDCEIKLFNHE